MPLFSINPPSNIYYFFQLVAGSLRFDFFFVNQFVKDFFTLNDYYEPYNAEFNNFGYETKVFILNVGFNAFLIIFMPIIVGLGCYVKSF